MPRGTSDFKRWFGKSKIVDKKRRPLVVYHGTAELTEFTEFRSWPGAHYFTVSPDYAASFTNPLGHPDFYRTGPIYPCYLSLQRPKELGDFDIEHLGYEPCMVEELKARGYDGAMTYDKRQIVVFYSIKIKFALM